MKGGGGKLDVITKQLFALQDEGYKQFHGKLIPEIESNRIIGVRTPELRKLAKTIAKQPYAYDFLKELPHTYYEENNLHGALIPLLYPDIHQCIEEIEKLLPYVDNWATCDMLPPKLFKKHLDIVYDKIKMWLHSDHTYEVRFGIVVLMGNYLDQGFQKEMLSLVAGIQSEEYYIKMAIAWYFSVALVKQYEATISYFTTPVLDTWTHNKALQKAIESKRISKETKDYLRNLKVRN